MGEDGRVYEGRGWTRVGAHTRGYNSRSIAICFIGNFQRVAPRRAAITAALRLIAQGLRRVRIPKTEVSVVYTSYFHFFQQYGALRI